MIDLMNLKKQYASIKDEVIESIVNVLDSGQFILGEQTKLFENNISEFLGVKHSIGVGNGTDALIISLRALNIGNGDEVIIPAMTFFATAEAVSQVGATPIFVDIDLKSYCIDVTQIESKISSKTKAIIPVHLYGHPADMVEIMEISKKHDLYVIEDACQAIGAKINGKNVTTFGDFSSISFFPTKNLGAYGDGGLISTNSDKNNIISRALRVHGSGELGVKSRELIFNDYNNSLEYEYDKFSNTKYNNSLIGFNSRLDEIQSAVLNVKLKYLDKWNSRRRDIAKFYDENIDNSLINKPKVKEGYTHVYYVYTITISEDRDNFIQYLKENNIGCGIYFPIPLHLQNVYKYLSHKKGDMINSEYLSLHGVSIPIYPELTSIELQLVVDVINKYRGENNV